MKKTAFMLFILATAIFLFGCTQNNSDGGDKLDTSNFALSANNNSAADANTKPEENTAAYTNLNEFKAVKKGDKIKVDYTGKLLDGSVFDSSIGREPLEFIVGAGQMIKGFDSGVIGMKIGETKTITLSPQEAYGEHDPALLRTFNANQLPDFNKLKPGMVLTATNGQTYPVVEVNDTNAVIDFNPPLAGKTLVFEIKLLSIE